MDENRFRHRGKRVIPAQSHHAEGRVQYLLAAEEQILRSIAAQAPISEVLNGICTALDCQLGNMVSLISVPGDGVVSSPEAARNAAVFGLHIFFSVDILSEFGQELGSLEMYCCTMRSPTSHELPLIERAACLAAIAMERETKAGGRPDHRTPESRPLHSQALRSPHFLH